ncbi:MAG: 50S ribosomal protein L11 methyltransferase [Clostridia bacterium]|nr:50S ribosomal protein L11 methyltransferase [Clostridia bacterium]
MKWYEISVKTNSEGTDLIADAFFTIGCLGGVKIIDKNDVIDILNSNLLWDYIDESIFQRAEIAQVSAFVSKEELSAKLDEFRKICTERNYPIGEINVTEIDDDSWYDSWKKFYSPLEIGNYAIVPEWINYENKNNLIKVLIDPGMAFGTGEHESTKMCLSLMSDIPFEGKDVIDVGTGSGILGVAAMLSGAKSCYMCDIDSVAVKAASENAKLNKVEDKVEIELADLLTKKDKKADVILANLTADILIRLSKDLPDHMQNGAVLICSGIIHERKKEVIDAFLQAGLTLEKDLIMGEWNGLRFKK